METEAKSWEGFTLHVPPNTTLTGRKTRSTKGCLKSKDDTILAGQNNIINTWTKYIEELHDDKGSDASIHDNGESPASEYLSYEETKGTLINISLGGN